MKFQGPLKRQKLIRSRNVFFQFFCETPGFPEIASGSKSAGRSAVRSHFRDDGDDDDDKDGDDGDDGDDDDDDGDKDDDVQEFDPPSSLPILVFIQKTMLLQKMSRAEKFEGGKNLGGREKEKETTR